MISSLHGTVLRVGTDWVEVLVGGMGFSVAVTTTHAAELRHDQHVTLCTELVVRDDALLLYGFADTDQRTLFSLLTGVTGVGPKSAMGVLSTLTADEIARAVADDDDKPFRRVSGIGPKTAKLIVVQLTGKVAPPTAQARTGLSAAPGVAEQVVAALVGLGWSERVADEAVAGLDADAGSSVAVLLRQALAALSPVRAEVGRG